MRYLLIVARERPGLFEYLTRQFAGDDKVQVLVDRRQEERRCRVESHEPERRVHDRRSQLGPEESLRHADQGLLIARQLQEAHARLSTLVQQLPAARDVGGSPPIGEPAALDRRQQLIKWIEEGQGLLRILPELLQETEHWKGRAEVAEQTAERLTREISRLHSEHEALRNERVELGQALRKLIEVLQPLSEKLQAVPSPPKPSPFHRRP